MIHVLSVRWTFVLHVHNIKGLRGSFSETITDQEPDRFTDCMLHEGPPGNEIHTQINIISLNAGALRLG